MKVRDFRIIRGMSEPFDPGKDAINRERHGLSLAFGDKIMADEAHPIIPSVRPRDGEERFKAIGLVEGKLHAAVFTWRNGWPRFISVRRSNAGEGRAYDSGL
ncbi:BrnT family toxin [Methylobacterium sp. WL30]|uniref:BrnT family toxin n=1 Tax=Methylobacterium sp. WL30 TaxID=2603895 RepID=UPI001FED2ADC|nr:BrnT family toxin [Methylobacterium sp. WL30]